MGGHIRKALVFAAAMGAALSGCAPVKTVEVPAPVVTAPAQPVLVAQPGPWRIRKTEWAAADEAGFGQFVRAIALSGCTTSTQCMQSAANPYHDSDPPGIVFPADCAKWVYMLRAYYASKNGLPFSYVSKISSDSGDPRFSTTSNGVISRRDVIDTGTAMTSSPSRVTSTRRTFRRKGSRATTATTPRRSPSTAMLQRRRTGRPSAKS